LTGRCKAGARAGGGGRAQVLQDRYGGFLSEQIVADFTHYAQAVFQALGGRVTYWSAPSMPVRPRARPPRPRPAPAPRARQLSRAPAPRAQDQNGTLGYVWACHNNVLRAHASAVREFRRIVPNGKIGMNLAVQWSEPRSDSAEDRVGLPARAVRC
jgi:beta-glucosidase